MTDSLGPVSSALENDVRDWLTKHNLVIWLDADNHYSDFVDKLIQLRQHEQLKYDVYTFHGSHLQLMLELEDVTSGVDKTRALIHLPGFNEETVKATPLFELYRAGKRYRKALPTLISDSAAGKVRPDQISEFLERGEPTLAAADIWLNDLLTTGTEGLTSQLRNTSLTELIDDLLFKRLIAQRLTSTDTLEDDLAAIWDRVTTLTGMPESWPDKSLSTSSPSAEEIAYTISSWALCVMYVCDLTCAPFTDFLQPVCKLPKQVTSACVELTNHLQDTHSDFYRQTADETESRLVDEIVNVKAKDLGSIDTFRFEEELILKAALQALQEDDWEVCQHWAELRSNPNAFWLRDDPMRRGVWQLVRDAARLGAAIQNAGPSLQSTDSLPSAVEEYTRVGAEVDQAHRHLEQDRQKLLSSQMPEFVALRSCLDRMQELWRDWANEWGRGFNNVCTSHGFLPDSSLRQRTLFDEEVKSLCSEHGATAYFVVDALRYEMGQELFAAIQDAAQSSVKPDVKLKWRLAELPSVTEVGMNVLAPVVVNDRLHLEMSSGRIQGFSTGEFRVSNPESRKRAMHDRIGGDTCPWLDLSEVLRRDATSLTRTIARSKLVVVHSREIDKAGEEGFGPAVFDDVMQQLKSAWHLLRDAGIRHFVFTADHGFLLIDEELHTAQPHGRKVDPKRRHVISTAAADHNDEVRVPLRDLGYECEEAHVMFPKSVAVFDTGKKQKGFAHGGNSFQERVIPVLTVSHRALAGGSSTTYDITAVKKAEVAGMHCVYAKVAVDALQKSLDFGATELDLGLKILDSDGVRAELCETRGGARLSSGTIIATVGDEFELFFRLSGSGKSRVQIQLYHPNAEAEVKPFTLKERFAVAYSAKAKQTESADAEEFTETWLEDLPDGPIRRVFQHLSSHGTITETEVSEMLGGPRKQRSFARKFEEYVKFAPFEARIETVSGVKRYVRQGASS